MEELCPSEPCGESAEQSQSAEDQNGTNSASMQQPIMVFNFAGTEGGLPNPSPQQGRSYATGDASTSLFQATLP